MYKFYYEPKYFDCSNAFTNELILLKIPGYET
jgi:hypothetical protein